MKRVKQVLESFNFDNVYKCMKALDWHWQDKGIPCKKWLKETARKLLEDVVKSNSPIATGGFKAFLDDDILCLEFTIEDAHSEENSK